MYFSAAVPTADFVALLARPLWPEPLPYGEDGFAPPSAFG